MVNFSCGCTDIGYMTRATLLTHKCFCNTAYFTRGEFELYGPSAPFAVVLPP
jgi:hypothetical protein